MITDTYAMIKYGSTFKQYQIQIRTHDDITRIRDYYDMRHDGWMTLIENGPWSKEMSGSMDVLMNRCNKTCIVKNQMDDLNEWHDADRDDQTIPPMS